VILPAESLQDAETSMGDPEEQEKFLILQYFSYS
jgi:hypothetical protein